MRMRYSERRLYGEVPAVRPALDRLSRIRNRAENYEVALEAIAEGCDDPQGLAQAALKMADYDPDAASTSTAA